MDKEQVLSWFNNAVADGWKCELLYASESSNTACKLTKDGFIAHVYRRDREYLDSIPWLKGNREEFMIYVWGPDGLAIDEKFYETYQDLTPGLRHCDYCKSDNNRVIWRVSFAGRCCDGCYPEQKRILEFPGWDN